MSAYVQPFLVERKPISERVLGLLPCQWCRSQQDVACFPMAKAGDQLPTSGDLPMF
jgi:hypothetical protein